MELDREGEDHSERALAELSTLICDLLLRDAAVVDGGSHLEIHLSRNDLQQKMVSVLGDSIADLPKDRLVALLISKVRQERRQNGQSVLTDNELPPGFSSN